MSGTSDPDQPRAINDRRPVLAFAKDLGAVQPGADADPLVVAIGHVRTPAVSYLGAQLAPWWTSGSTAKHLPRPTIITRRSVRSPCAKPSAAPNWSTGTARRGRY
nr:DUF5127 domain-containing protein [Amycolatopsis rubida]